jgi:hypothetical protein
MSARPILDTHAYFLVTYSDSAWSVVKRNAPNTRNLDVENKTVDVKDGKTWYTGSIISSDGKNVESQLFAVLLVYS